MKFIILGVFSIIIGFITTIFADDPAYLILMSIFGIGLIFGSKYFEDEGALAWALHFWLQINCKCNIIILII